MKPFLTRWTVLVGLLGSIVTAILAPQQSLAQMSDPRFLIGTYLGGQQSDWHHQSLQGAARASTPRCNSDSHRQVRGPGRDSWNAALSTANESRFHRAQ